MEIFIDFRIDSFLFLFSLHFCLILTFFSWALPCQRLWRPVWGLLAFLSLVLSEEDISDYSHVTLRDVLVEVSFTPPHPSPWSSNQQIRQSPQSQNHRHRRPSGKVGDDCSGGSCWSWSWNKLTSIISSSSSCVGLLPGTGTIATKNPDSILSSRCSYEFKDFKILLWTQRLQDPRLWTQRHLTTARQRPTPSSTLCHRHPGGFQNYFVKFIIFTIETLSNMTKILLKASISSSDITTEN